MTIDKVNADAGEIEITPGMVGAGIAVLREYEDFCSALSPTLEEILVRKILEACLLAPHKDDEGTLRFRPVTDARHLCD